MFPYSLLLAASSAPPVAQGHGEESLVLPELSTVDFSMLPGIHGDTLLKAGLVICVLGIVFGILMLKRMSALPVHAAMKAVSELIYDVCKTYLKTQGRFIILLYILVGAIIAIYFGALRGLPALKVITILGFSLLGILGSFSVAWFGMRVNTFASSRVAFASLEGKSLPCHAIPLRAGISIGMLLISIELLLLISTLLFVPHDYTGPCFLGFAIGASLGASVLRIAGGIFTKIADIGADLMKIVFNIKEDDARNPGVIADCAGDNAGDSVGPTADGFETYGVTAVALVTFILLAVHDAAVQSRLIVWLFALGVTTIVSSGLAYVLNYVFTKSHYKTKKMDFEAPLTSLVWVTSFITIGMTYLMSYLVLKDLANPTLWWKLASTVTCGALAGALIPEVVKVFTSTRSRHVRECVEASREGGASLNVLAGLTAGNFSAYWLGMVIVALMAGAFFISGHGLGELMKAEAVFAVGLVAFGFLAMGPVTIAVDSYGPVSDNAQSVYELSSIESTKGIEAEIERDFQFKVDWSAAKDLLEENDGAGNTFKATSKPVLIGTAVVGATTMIFSLIMILTNGLDPQFMPMLSVLNQPLLFGLILGGAVIYWFSGASTQAVATGAHRAVMYIKKNIKLHTDQAASAEDSEKVVEICTQYAQKGMFNIFLTVFFSTLAFACFDPYLFVGYLISMATFGLFQALFMANAGGAWDNAKKVVETELRAKGTPLHAAAVVGDTVGDPFKDTSSVAMNPVIKFTTLFGVLAVQIAIEVPSLAHWLAVPFLLISMVFVYRSFYGMRIQDVE